MSGKRRRSFKCAVHQLDREVSSEHDFHLVLRQPPLFTSCVRAGYPEVAAVLSPSGAIGERSLMEPESSHPPLQQDGADNSGRVPHPRAGPEVLRRPLHVLSSAALHPLHHPPRSLEPPPPGWVITIAVTKCKCRIALPEHYGCFLFQLAIMEVKFQIIIPLQATLGFFTYYTVATGEMNPAGPVPIDSVFIYRPDKREEIWRFFFYMVLHAGWLHLLFNLLVQVLVGLPLEMVHGSLRIGTVYMAGVLAGSLGTSVFDMDVYLVGASGGVYALLAAHLANVLLNYNNMEFGIVRLVGIFVVASADVGFAIYDRYANEAAGPPVSYVAHLTGALAGLTIGLLVLKNFEQKLHEQLIWWVALGVYAACTIFAVLFNLFTPSFPP
ncbi:unnamed protein product [Nezara viridula]|uniref:rhomboid protease n=1 Tax=Nezara viridula TaxID=85310 RepID=A0A9P0DYB8_NEZVI|nr:unnamed protein product [Nezara viridula]